MVKRQADCAIAAVGAVSLQLPIAAILAFGVMVAAALSQGDASWDFRNYHLYDPFALLNKPPGVDIAPAHMQTFFPPTLDLYNYALARSIGSTALLNALLSLPQALAVVCAFALSWRLLRPVTTLEQLTLSIFTVLGATGVAGGTTIATTMNEMAPAALFLLALLLLIPRDLKTAPPAMRLLGAGLLVGAACGLKLTMSYLTITLALSLVCIPRRSALQLATRPAMFGCGVLFGAVALSGYWWAREWMLYGNPFFPLMNQVFQSPLAVHDSFVDRTFLPRSLAAALAAPWMWALQLSWATSESRLRDPRFALAMIAALVVMSRLLRQRERRPPWPILLVTTVFILGFALWRVEFSIFRYLATLELLTGTMLALAILPLARRGMPAITLAAAGILLAACLVITVYPQMSRTPAGSPPLAVDFGPLPPDSMVLLLDNEPMAYLAAFADPRIRFIATNDFFMTLDRTNPMQAQVETAIENHRGPLWGLDSPPEQKDRSDHTLARYHLVRGRCRPVRTNVSPLAIRLCRLERSDAVSSAQPYAGPRS